MSEPAATASDSERRSPAALPPPPRPVPAGPDIDTPPIIPDRAVSSRWRWIWIALLVAVVPTLVVLFGFNPSLHAFYPVCVFHRMTGLQCPGCGGLRAVHHLLHGEVITAFRFNPLFVLALPFAAWSGVRRLLHGPRAQPISHRAQARWAWAALAILIVFWIVRNLPLEILKLPAD